jgi:tRNA nucleotidyltransferase/poly(A) polymerase
MVVFQNRGYKAIPTGEEFGTITVIYEDKPYEITTYRSEGKYTDSRHPEHIKWEKDINKDLSRRDFTINAIGFDIIHNKFIDPYGGRADIKNHILRAVGNPSARFKDDPLRMMRFIRFAGRYGIKADPKTFDAIKRQHKLLKKIPKERVRDELLKTLQSDDVDTSIRLFIKSGLADEVIPGLSKLEGMPQNELYHKYDVLTHSIKAVENVPKNKPMLRLVALLHDIEKPDKDHATLGRIKAEKLADDLKLSKAEREYLTEMIGHHMDMFSYQKKITPRDVRRYINRLPKKEIIDDLIVFNIADIKASGTPRTRIFGEEFAKSIKEVREKKEPTGVKSLAIRGENVMSFGFRGPEVGVILKTLAEDVIENPKHNNKEYLLERIKNIKNEMFINTDT